MSYAISLTCSKFHVNSKWGDTMDVELVVSNVTEVLNEISDLDIVAYVENETLVDEDWCLGRLTIEDCINHFGLLNMKDEVVKLLIKE